MKALRVLSLLLILPLVAAAENTADIDSLLKKLDASTWVAEGAEHPQRLAYVFTDMACPYCATLWQHMQPFIQQPDNTLQVRHIVVGLVNPKRSFSQGGAVLAADHPAAALAWHESRFAQGGIDPLLPVPANIRRQIHSNTGLMMGLGLSATPSLIFQDSKGQWRMAQGVVSKQALREQVFQLEKPNP